jgi:hypothetical protein
MSPKKEIHDGKKRLVIKPNRKGNYKQKKQEQQEQRGDVMLEELKT